MAVFKEDKMVGELTRKRQGATGLSGYSQKRHSGYDLRRRERRGLKSTMPNQSDSVAKPTQLYIKSRWVGMHVWEVKFFRVSIDDLLVI
jgi:hypothetical protein